MTVPPPRITIPAQQFPACNSGAVRTVLIDALGRPTDRLTIEKRGRLRDLRRRVFFGGAALGEWAIRRGEGTSNH